jgi:hypothetical protein
VKKPVAVGVHAVPQRRISLLGRGVEAKSVRQRALGGDPGIGEGSDFSEIIRLASSAAFGAPEANSMRRAEMTLCASQLKRTASVQWLQKSFIVLFDRYSAAPAKRARDRSNIAKVF